jgi:hypothetical protein
VSTEPPRRMRRPSKTTAADLMASVADGADPAYRLSRDYRLLEVNEAFRRFARDNGGAEMLEHLHDMSALTAISGPLREYFAETFERVRKLGTPWHHEYACSSPERARTFHMIIYPAGEEFVVVHSCTAEGPHTTHPCAPDAELYVREGQIKLCSHCRRVQNHSEPRRWDWVPSYLQQAPADVSHGLCEPCTQFYWP